jgi:hypothetical protein
LNICFCSSNNLIQYVSCKRFTQPQAKPSQQKDKEQHEKERKLWELAEEYAEEDE